MLRWGGEKRQCSRLCKDKIRMFLTAIKDSTGTQPLTKNGLTKGCLLFIQFNWSRWISGLSGLSSRIQTLCIFLFPASLTMSAPPSCVGQRWLQDSCSASKHHILTGLCPKKEGRGLSKGPSPYVDVFYEKWKCFPGLSPEDFAFISQN